MEKDVKNLASKQIFARWQSILSIFNFDIEYIKGSNNSIPDFLTREFLQSENGGQKKDNQLDIPPIGLVNRFQVLGTIPRPNYQSALARPVGSKYIVKDRKSVV